MTLFILVYVFYILLAICLFSKLVCKDKDIVILERKKLKNIEAERNALVMKISTTEGSDLETLKRKLEETHEIEEGQRCLVENLEFQMLEVLVDSRIMVQ